MSDHEAAMLNYLTLADWSQRKGQSLPRDKFLLLAGAAACRSGLPDIADYCRRQVLANNTAHLIGRYASFSEALKSDDYRTFEKQLQKFCSAERAEHLVGWAEAPPESPPLLSVDDVRERLSL